MAKRTITERKEVWNLQQLLDWFEDQDVKAEEVSLQSNCYCGHGEDGNVVAEYDRPETDSEQLEREEKEKTWKALRRAEEAVRRASREAIQRKEELMNAQMLYDINRLDADGLRKRAEELVIRLEEKRAGYEFLPVADSLEGTRIKAEMNCIMRELDCVLSVVEKRGLTYE